MTVETEVLVVGAGYAGLSTAMYLAQHGIRTLLVERHAGTSPHPKASGQTWRAMELYRFAGIEEEIRKSTLRATEDVIISAAANLAGPITQLANAAQQVDASAATPMAQSPAGQDAVEPVLARRAEQLGVDLRFGVELESFDQDRDGVTAVIRDRWSGDESAVSAQYLVAADGYRSPIRARLGIPFDGQGGLRHLMGVVFDADLGTTLPPEIYQICFVNNDQCSGMVINTEQAGRYLLSISYDPEQGEDPSDFTSDRLRQIIRAVAGDSGLEPEIVNVTSWEVAAKIAQRFRENRTFLVGDAAKVAPPSGGQGGNTAVGDGNNLAWKLFAVLRGEAGEALLDTYETERRPIAQAVVDLSVRNLSVLTNPETEFARLGGSLDVLDLILGFQYRSAAVCSEDDDFSLTENPLTPSGRPGFRAPDGDGLSISSLLGTGWTLLTRTEHWRAAAETCGVACYVLPGLNSTYREATLVRPDGIVAWRTGDPIGEPVRLRTVLDRVLSRQ